MNTSKTNPTLLLVYLVVATAAFSVDLVVSWRPVAFHVPSRSRRPGGDDTHGVPGANKWRYPGRHARTTCRFHQEWLSKGSGGGCRSLSVLTTTTTTTALASATVDESPSSWTSEDEFSERNVVPAATAGVDEYWLDLRATAFLRDEALLLLDTLLSNHQSSVAATALPPPPVASRLVRQVVTSEAGFRNALEKGQDQDLLYVTSEDPQSQRLMQYNAMDYMSSVQGRVLTPKKNEIMLDPMEALEAMDADNNDSGSWILLSQRPPENNIVSPKSNNNHDNNAWVDQVTGLVQFLSAATPSSVWDLADTKKQRKGIAMECTSQTDLLALENVLTDLQLSRQTHTTTTDSGIIVPGRASAGEKLKFALVLPLDLDLWKTVLEIKAEEF